ncbi:MAG: hypothetical protein AMXMBFR53_16540 [Gemmatimonadota bacterium]
METNPFRAARTSRGEGRPPAGSTPPTPLPRSGVARRWVEERVAGRTWWARAPVLLLLAWVLRSLLADPQGFSLFGALTLGFHEMGHASFSWTGHRILTAAGGTIFQLLVPLAAAAYLAWKQRDPFGAAVCLFWLGTALVDAGVYAADARAQALPLVSPFGPVDADSHDWTVMLMKFGMLSRDQAIGGALVGAGRALMAASLAAGAWVLWVMARTPQE